MKRKSVTLLIILIVSIEIYKFNAIRLSFLAGIDTLVILYLAYIVYIKKNTTRPWL
jgi:hypothetical protein